MIDEEELRQLLLREGHPQKLVDAYCEWFYGPTGWAWCLDQIESAFDAMRQIIAGAADQMEKMLAQITDMEIIYPPKTKPRRPPRYAGPQNKGRTWNRQPPRLARSDCRKMRR